ncbi:hypothetical protein C8J57DRAFT_1247130 [Mycena rebaudengoi]|nr:hypothetical protein C8J57DRAFT_1247130 [Mycena rebaudengoi]
MSAMWPDQLKAQLSTQQQAQAREDLRIYTRRAPGFQCQALEGRGHRKHGCWQALAEYVCPVYGEEAAPREAVESKGDGGVLVDLMIADELLKRRIAAGLASFASTRRIEDLRVRMRLRRLVIWECLVLMPEAGQTRGGGDGTGDRDGSGRKEQVAPQMHHDGIKCTDHDRSLKWLGRKICPFTRWQPFGGTYCSPDRVG